MMRIRIKPKGKERRKGDSWGSKATPCYAITLFRVLRDSPGNGFVFYRKKAGQVGLIRTRNRCRLSFVYMCCKCGDGRSMIKT